MTGQEGDVFTTADIFVFQQTGLAPDGKVHGQFVPTGYVPAVRRDAGRRGIKVPREIFLPSDGLTHDLRSSILALLLLAVGAVLGVARAVATGHRLVDAPRRTLRARGCRDEFDTHVRARCTLERAQPSDHADGARRRARPRACCSATAPRPAASSGPCSRARAATSCRAFVVSAGCRRRICRRDRQSAGRRAAD